MYNEPSLKERDYSADKVVKRDNGNPNGMKAIVASLGRSACEKEQSIFDCPYEIGTEYYDIWTDAYIEQEKKLKSA